MSASSKLSLTLLCLLHICIPLVTCSYRLVTKFPIFWKGEGSRYYIHIDHDCLLPNAYLQIICDYLFISLKHYVCRLYNGGKSFSNQRNKFSHISSARKNCTSQCMPCVPGLYLVDLLSRAR